MVTPIRQIATRGMLYDPDVYDKAIQRQNRQMLADIYAHGVNPYYYVKAFRTRKRFCRYRLSRKPLRRLLRYFSRHGLKNYKKTWNFRNQKNFNRMMYSIEEGFPFLMYENDDKEYMFVIRQHLCMENAVIRCNRLSDYMRRFNDLRNKDYLDFIKTSLCRPQKQVPKPLLLQFD